MTIKKICIAGNFSIAIECTKYLLKNFKNIEIYSITNENDNSQDTFQPSFKKFCKKNKIQIIKLDESYNLRNMIFFSLHFDKIIKTENFKTSKLYNIHFSLLPKYKGMHTTAWPILNGDFETGVTLHKIDNGIDTGSIISKLKFPININDNAEKVFLNYLKYGLILFKKKIHQIIKGQYKTKKQSLINSTYYSKKSINFKNILIDFNKTAFEVHNQIRSMVFEYYQLPIFKKKKIISSKILTKKSTFKPGTILNKNRKRMIISTIDYNLHLRIK